MIPGLPRRLPPYLAVGAQHSHASQVRRSEELFSHPVSFYTVECMRLGQVFYRVVEHI
jgi:hypothetical protein